MASLPSLVEVVSGEAYTPRWLWASMMPGVTYRPVPSTSSAPGGVATSAFRPTATSFPSTKATAPSSMAGPEAGITVA